MSLKIDAVRRRFESLEASSWTIAAIIVVAAVTRFLMVAEWSLWQDEETTIYFSQRIEKPWPTFFPTFFYLLHSLYQLTGVSVAAGRMLVAMIGVLSVGLTYFTLRRLISEPVALLTALFVAVSLGHLFWSQSIRYYILLFVFNLLSICWFLEGFERGKLGKLMLANLALLLGVLTHFSAALLIPVFVGHLALSLLRRESGGGYTLKGYLTFGIPFVIFGVFFLWRFLVFRSTLSALIVGDINTGPLGLLVRFAAYFGVPVVVLGLLSPLLARGQVAPRVLQFFLLTGILPVLELMVIAELRLAIIAWYYAFFALLGFSTLAAISIVCLYRRGYRLISSTLFVGTILYSIVVLYGYYTTMRGDRPRWEEATAFLHRERNVNVRAPDNPDIFALVPGVVAFYLGVNPGETMGNPLVQTLPPIPVDCETKVDQWFLVNVRGSPPELLDWLKNNCKLAAEYPAYTGPINRSILVYHRRKSGIEKAISMQQNSAIDHAK